MPKNYVIDASNTTEDCLHINVWVPGRCVNHTRRRAVVFWLFGGSFVSGGNSYDFYDGRFLAGLGGVVVAVPNYRVASFGFLNSGTGHVPGNMGLHDLLLALRWLQDNIESFGGDTERILVAGQSAGAIAASLLMASEHRNLFRRAYLMSGTLRTPLPDNDGYNARRNFAQFVADAGCKAGKIADSVHCLREANTTAILEASKRAALSLMPNVRGRVFQSHLEIHSREDAAPYKLEVLMSSTLSEGRAFFEMLLPAFVANADKITSSMLKSTFPYFFNSLSDSILDVAIGLLGTLYDLEDLERVGWTELIGDALFRCPTRAFAQELTHFGSTVYYHEYVPKPSFTVFGGNYATHSDDVPILFGYPFLYPHLATDEERQTSHRMIMTLSNFAKNG
ncbi:acetylcholinesterase-1 [Dermacentor silvarum]|uniref:acetylcholinesterase-1 n=1 Tax=Dermacentor silvarum TaxID=543639 RepID=UPI00189804AE|nr:acetylcholinesterase-1 [Dermacentor silvarum]